MKEQKPKLIIFDLDGTLIDAYPAITESFNYTMRVLGYPDRKDSVIRRAVGWGDRFLLKPFIKEKDLNRALLIYRRHHKDSLIRYSKMLPFAAELLGYLKRSGYKLAVASNRPDRFSRILIHFLGLNKYFDYVLCADKLKTAKPHPEIIFRIIKRLHLSPAQALYIGDMAIDAQAGRRSGVKTIIVTTGSSSKREIAKEKPLLIINSLKKLVKIL